MEINRNNVEAYLLDQLEGRLSAEGERKLREFLALNPDCDPGLEADDLRTLNPETVLYAGKDVLRKEIPESGQPVTRSRFDLFSVARLEGDLTEAQVSEYQRMVEEDPHLGMEWEEWKQTRLPEVSVAYPGKAGLRKPDRRLIPLPWITLLSSAAALVMVLLLITFRSGPSTQLGQETAPAPSKMDMQEVDPRVDPRLSQEPLQAEGPAEGNGRVIASDQQGNEGQEAQKRAQVQPEREDGPSGHSSVANALADQEGTGTKSIVPGETDRLSNENVKELMESSLGTRLATTLGPAPVPEGTRDRIRPIHLPPAEVRHRGPGISDLADLDLQEAVEAYAEEKNLSLFSIASAGIKGINRITGSELELYAAKDKEGEISGFKFKSKRLNISTPLQKSE